MDLGLNFLSVDLVLGKAWVVEGGSDICLMSTGNMLPTAMEAASEMARGGVRPQVVSFHTVKPLDEKFLAEAFSQFRIVATIEEHSKIGGFGAAVAEWLADRPAQRGRLCRIGTEDAFFHEAGEQEYARERLGLTPHHIVEKVLGIGIPARSGD